MSCSTCITTFSGNTRKIGKWIHYMHQASLQSLWAAKRQGCPLCRMLWDHFVGADIEGPPTKLRGLSLAEINTMFFTSVAAPAPKGAKTVNILQLQCWFKANYSTDSQVMVIKDDLTITRPIYLVGQRGIYSDWLEPLLFEMLHTKEPDRRLLRELGDGSGSTQSLEKARKWLDTCLNTHTCQQCSDASEINDCYPYCAFFPDRILDVGQPGDQTIRLQSQLRFTGSDPKPYATLSYAWGNGAHKKLNKDTLEQLSKGIDVSALPKTMREAIEVTRQLGIQYLWIDSLCILQDSKDDWRQQSSQMARIYHMSRVNIAATSSADSEGGLFYKRSPESIRPIQVQCHFPFYDRTKPRQWYSILLQKPWYISLDKAHLNSRGWVVQERLLPPRTLHFSKDQIYWECITMYASESYPEGIKTSVENDPAHFHRRLTEIGYAKQNGQSIPTEVYKFWLGVVEQYSACKLTMDGDILIALSGLALMWKRVLGHEYLAGLWKESLPYTLAWKAVTTISIGNSRSTVWRAPSWSWASLKGAVKWGEHVTGPHPQTPHSIEATLVEVLDSQIQGVTGDKTGQLVSGSILLRGALVAGTAIYDGTKELPGNSAAKKQPSDIQLSLSEGTMVKKFSLNTGNLKFTGISVFDDLAKANARMKERGFMSLFGVPTLLLRSDYLADKQIPASADIELEGILVEKSDEPGARDGDWKRVGYFRVWASQTNVVERDKILAALKGLTVTARIDKLKLGGVKSIRVI